MLHIDLVTFDLMVGPQKCILYRRVSVRYVIFSQWNDILFFTSKLFCCRDKCIFLIFIFSSLFSFLQRQNHSITTNWEVFMNAFSVRTFLFIFMVTELLVDRGHSEKWSDSKDGGGRGTQESFSRTIHQSSKIVLVWWFLERLNLYDLRHCLKVSTYVSSFILVKPTSALGRQTHPCHIFTETFALVHLMPKPDPAWLTYVPTSSMPPLFGNLLPNVTSTS